MGSREGNERWGKGRARGRGRESGEEEEEEEEGGREEKGRGRRLVYYFGIVFLNIYCFR